MSDRPRHRLGMFLGVAGWLVAAALAGVLVAPALALRGKITAGDSLRIEVLGTLPNQPIWGDFDVSPQGRLSLGPSYGSVDVAGLNLPEAKSEITGHLEAIIRAPEVWINFAATAPYQWLRQPLVAHGWIVASILALLLSVTTVRAYTVPEPRRRWLQFGVGTLLWLMIVVALAVIAFDERRERLRLESDIKQSLREAPLDDIKVSRRAAPLRRPSILLAHHSCGERTSTRLVTRSGLG